MASVDLLTEDVIIGVPGRPPCATLGLCGRIGDIKMLRADASWMDPKRDPREDPVRNTSKELKESWL
eukprot:860562-Rhodomonas_salina.2